MVDITQFTARPYTQNGDPEDPDVYIVIRPDGAPLQDESQVPVDGIVHATFLAKMTDQRPVQQKFVAFLNPDGTPLSITGLDPQNYFLVTNNFSELVAPEDKAEARENLDVYSTTEVDNLITNADIAIFSDDVEVEPAADAINFLAPLKATSVGGGGVEIETNVTELTEISYYEIEQNDYFITYTSTGPKKVTYSNARGINVITDATAARVASAVDAFGYIRFTNAGDVTYTIEADNDLPLKSVITLRDVACNSLTIVADGTTVNPPFGGTLVSAGPGATIQIVKVAANEYDVFGHVGAV